MFLASKVEIQNAFFDGEIFSLNKFELSAFMPWFICEVHEYDDDSEEVVCTTTHLIGDIEELANLACTHKIDKTYLVCPGHILNQESWSMTRLKSISHATYTHDEYKSSVYRFETFTGGMIEYDIRGMNEGKYRLTFETIMQFG